MADQRQGFLSKMRACGIFFLRVSVVPGLASHRLETKHQTSQVTSCMPRKLCENIHQQQHKPRKISSQPLYTFFFEHRLYFFFSLLPFPHSTIPASLPHSISFPTDLNVLDMLLRFFQVPVSVLWHARVNRCRTAAELAVHLRNLSAVLDTDFMAEATGGGGLGKRGARVTGLGSDSVTVLNERFDSEAGQVEVLLRVGLTSKKVRGGFRIQFLDMHDEPFQGRRGEGGRGRVGYIFCGEKRANCGLLTDRCRAF